MAAARTTPQAQAGPMAWGARAAALWICACLLDAGARPLPVRSALLRVSVSPRVMRRTLSLLTGALGS